jgi:hypothetical protein
VNDPAPIDRTAWTPDEYAAHVERLGRPVSWPPQHSHAADRRAELRERREAHHLSEYLTTDLTTLLEEYAA